MSRFAFAFIGAIACAPPVEPARTALTVASVPAVHRDASPSPSVTMCKTPRGIDRTDSPSLDAFMFGTCEDFEATFFSDLASACSEAAPDLAQAMALAGAPYEKDAHAWGNARNRNSFILFRAAALHVPSSCRGHVNFEGFPEDDYGRLVHEITTAWREDPACRADAELFEVTTIDSGHEEVFPQGDVDVGLYFFAVALRPHLTPLGTAYLRKALFCSQVEHDSGWRHRMKHEKYRGPDGVPGADESEP